MPDIAYRPYHECDAADVKSMIDEAFHIHRYLKRKHLLGSALEVYLRERLLASTYTRVAVKDGRAVGVIMGRVPGRPRVPRAVRSTLSGHPENGTIHGDAFLGNLMPGRHGPVICDSDATSRRSLRV